MVEERSATEAAGPRLLRNRRGATVVEVKTNLELLVKHALTLLTLALFLPGAAAAHGPVPAQPKAADAAAPIVVELAPVVVKGAVNLPAQLMIPRARIRFGPTPTELSLLRRAGQAPAPEPLPNR